MTNLPFLPAIMTTANLACGVLSCVFALNDALRLEGYKDVLSPFAASAWLIVAAVVFDALDGLVARKTKSESRFGIEYDSLADVVSFGMAPALLLYVAVLRLPEYGRFGWLFVLMYVVCGAIRLARFNTMAANGSTGKFFLGLPIPAAAGLLTSYVLFSMWGEWHVVDQGAVFNKMMGWYQQRITYVNRVILPLGMALVSLLMVSTIEYPKVHQVAVKGRVPFPVFVVSSLILVLFALAPLPVGSFFMFVTYVGWGLVNTVFQRGAQHVKTAETGRRLEHQQVVHGPQGR